MAASIVTFFALILIQACRACLGLEGLWSAILAMPRAFFFSFAFPVVATGLDTVLIAVATASASNGRSLYLVPAIRSSSLLPYSFRTVMAASLGKLSFKNLVAASPTPLDIALLLVGYALTAYGLHRVLRISVVDSLAGAVPPLTYKLILGILF